MEPLRRSYRKRVGGDSMPAPGPSTLDAPPRLVDLSTGLPSLTSLFSEFRPLTESQTGATVLYIHLPSNQLIEERFGWEALEAYTGLVTTFLGRMRRDLRHERDHCVVARAFADDYVVVCPSRADDSELPAWLATGMRRHLQAVDEELTSLHQVYVGVAAVPNFAKVHPERRLYRGIQRAQREATDVGRQRLSVQASVLDGCIAKKKFRMVYQPIVDATSLSIYAYEALVRCAQPELKNPHVLFNIAEQSGRIWPLSRVLRRMAVESIVDVSADQLMFINLHPDDFEDPQLLQPESFVVENASKIVFEVTERATISDFDRFRANLDVLRKVGVRIAVDDLGSGYAALNSVAELTPDFIKFDMTLVRDIDESPIRQNLLRNMIAFARDSGSLVIGEGVETAAELATLIEIGCHYVQGYYLAMPGPDFVTAIELPPPDTGSGR